MKVKNHANLFILGAPKAGTTSLHYYLSQHSDVIGSSPKEPRYWDDPVGGGGPAGYWQQNFSHYAGESVALDARPSNLFVPHVAKLVHEYNPTAKLLVLCRNPIERAYSHWWMRVTSGRETLSFADALKKNFDRISQLPEVDRMTWVSNINPGTTRSDLYTYIDMGYYAEQILRYRDLFGPMQIQVHLFEDLIRDPEKIAQRVFEWCKIDTNTSAINFDPKLVKQGRGVRLLAPLRKAGIGRLFPNSVRSTIRAVLGHWGKQPALDGKTLQMLSEHYRPHNQHLAQLIGRDLSHWNSNE